MRCTCWILHWLDLDGTSCTVAIAVCSCYSQQMGVKLIKQFYVQAEFGAIQTRVPEF